MGSVLSKIRSSRRFISVTCPVFANSRILHLHKSSWWWECFERGVVYEWVGYEWVCYDCVCFERECFERGCNERVCYECVCFEREWYERVWYERVCNEMVCVMIGCGMREYGMRDELRECVTRWGGGGVRGCVTCV